MAENQAHEVDTATLSTNDIIVVCMGPTGSGKSSFIEKATGIMGIAGHSLQSCTSDISVIRFPGTGSVDLCLVDTPGFDDTNKSDLEIFKMVSAWLSKTYNKKVRLSGLLYFHRISDNRMTGTALKNFRLFEELCGHDFRRIVLTTTMWGEVDEEIGEAREEDIKRDHWRPMIERGSYVKRFLYSKDSAFDILLPFLDEANSKGTLLLQKEMNDNHLQLKETSAGKTLKMELGELVANQKDLLARIRKELKDPTTGPDQLLLLMKDHQEASLQLQRATEDLRKLKKSSGGRISAFKRFFSKWTRSSGSLIPEVEGLSSSQAPWSSLRSLPAVGPP